MIDSFVGWILDNLTGVASLVLTTALVALYYQQKEILRVEKLPEVEIASRTIDGNQLEVTVSNYGHGLAKDVRFCTSIHAPDAEEFEPVLVESRARRVGEGSETTLEQSVRPQESHILFRGEPKMGYRLNGEEHRYADFSTGFGHLRRAGIESVWFQIFVVVDDQLGGCQAKPLFWPARSVGDVAKEIDVSNDRLDLEGRYERGGLYNPDEQPEILTPDCRE